MVTGSRAHTRKVGLMSSSSACMRVCPCLAHAHDLISEFWLQVFSECPVYDELIPALLEVELASYP